MGEHDKSFGSVDSRLLLARNDGSFQNRRMFNQCAFNFDGRNPLPRYSKHVIGTARIPVVAVLINFVLVSREKPAASDSALGQVLAIPISLRGAWPGDH